MEQDYSSFSGLLISRSSSIQPKQVDFRFYVYGDTTDDCEINVSNLIADCSNCTIKLHGSKLEYLCILQSAASEKTGIDGYSLVTLTFAAIQRGHKVVIPLPATRIYVEGNAPPPCRVVLTPENDTTNTSILGITISDLLAGETFVIDRLAEMVTDLSRTNMIDFPTLSLGWNNLSIQNGVAGTLEYYPIYL